MVGGLEDRSKGRSEKDCSLWAGVRQASAAVPVVKTGAPDRSISPPGPCRLRFAPST